MQGSDAVGRTGENGDTRSTRRGIFVRASRAWMGALMAGFATLLPVQKAPADSCDQYFGEFKCRGDAVNVFAHAIFVCSEVPGFDAEAIAKFYRETFPGWRPVPTFDGVPEGSNLSMLAGRKVLVIGSFQTTSNKVKECLRSFPISSVLIDDLMSKSRINLTKTVADLYKNHGANVPYVLQDNRTLIGLSGAYDCEEDWRLLTYSFGQVYTKNSLPIDKRSLPIPSIFDLNDHAWR